MTSTDTQAPANNTASTVFGILGWAIVVALSYLILLFVLSGPHFFGHAVKVGDLAEYELVAPKKSLVVDDLLTAKAREHAAREVIPVMRRDPEKTKAVISKLKQQIESVATIRDSNPAKDVSKLSLSQLRDLFALDDTRLTNLLNLKPSSQDQTIFADLQRNVDLHSCFATFDQIRRKYPDQRAERLYLAVHCANLSEFQEAAKKSAERFVDRIDLHPYDQRQQWQVELYEFLPESWPDAQRTATASLLASQIEPNVSLDQKATEDAVKKAVSNVKPVLREIEIGQLIVSRGDVITKDNIEALKAVGITQVKDPGLAALIAVALSAAFGLVGIFLHQYAPRLFFSPSSLAMMSTVGIVVCAVAASPFGADVPQLIPLPAATLTLALTYGKRVTAVIVALIAIFLSVSGLVSGAHLVALSSAAAVALAMKVKRRKDLMLTGFLVGFMQMLGYVIAVLCGLSNNTTVNFAVDLPLEVAGGLFSAVLAIGSLPFLETIFGILTPYRIAELAEPDQPLMRQLEENAPGTYQHSLAVANLAEGGARAISADVCLVRTGAMYHDIGKMVTPRYFIENQLGDKNPHDVIAPEESRAKVLAHVTNGLALAQKYGLPKAVQAFIPEHQGTTVMAYFYHKACLRDGADKVDQSDYRYPGPKPQTKESAIVMLADVSEAVTHSMKDPSHEEVEEAIARVFKARWEDGQFNESSLTSEELERVKQGFLRVWRTLHHDRLKYPSTTTGRMPIAPPPGPPAPSATPQLDTAAATASSERQEEEISCCGNDILPEPALETAGKTREEVASDK